MFAFFFVSSFISNQWLFNVSIIPRKWLGHPRDVGIVDYFSYPNAHTLYYENWKVRLCNATSFVTSILSSKPTAHKRTLYTKRSFGFEYCLNKVYIHDFRFRISNFMFTIFIFILFLIQYIHFQCLIFGFWYIRKSYELIIVYSLHYDCTRFRFQLFNILEIANGVAQVIIIIIINKLIEYESRIFNYEISEIP